MKQLLPFFLVLLFVAGCYSPADQAAGFHESGTQKGIAGDIDGARKDFDKAIELLPAYAAAFHNRGFYCFLPAGDYEEALADFTRSIELSGGDGDAYSLSMRGFVWLKLDQPEKALSDLEASLEKDTENPYVYLNLAHYMLYRGDTADACANLRLAIQKGFTEKFGNEAVDMATSLCP
jgi:tetratricopeptide (TPR) repeat protein